MQSPHYVECPGPLPNVEGIAVVASTNEAKFIPLKVEMKPNGKTWRSLVLVREGHSSEQIEIRPVRESPLVLEISYSTKSKCGPIAFHLAMESHGRILDGFL